MGTTYAARRLRDGFPVALKVPHEHILEEPEFVERFLREGALGAMLHHPNIVRIYEAGEHAGRPFIAMEIVPGTTLERILRKEQRLPLARALHVARGIALALDYAHMKGIVHRDLKPENVMILPDGEVKVMDYGIARRMDVSGLTATDAYLGTPNYSAPESLTPVRGRPAVGPLQSRRHPLPDALGEPCRSPRRPRSSSSTSTRTSRCRRSRPSSASRRRSTVSSWS